MVLRKEERYLGRKWLRRKGRDPLNLDGRKTIHISTYEYGLFSQELECLSFFVHELKNPDIQKNTVMESRNASFFEYVFPCLSKETGKLSQLEIEVVQDKMTTKMIMIAQMRDKSQNLRKKMLNKKKKQLGKKQEKSFGPDFVSFMVENEPGLIEKQ
ncbi:hypothetical protein Tco_1142905 [Tanacetum coccineum]